MKKHLLLLLASACLTAQAEVVATMPNRANGEMKLTNTKCEDRPGWIVFSTSGTKGDYMLSIEGACSIDTSTSGKTFTAICKTGPGAYKKHFLGLSDNVTFFAEQMGAVEASAYHYRVTFKPQTILPDIDFRGSLTDLPRNQK